MIDTIRADFPALERWHNGFPVAYFDGPGGTQVPRQVIAAVSDYLIRHNANDGWAYPSSKETDAVIANARQTVADFFNAEANEIAFGQNMTSLTFHLSRAIGRRLKPGDELIVTELDHHANVDTWKELAKDRGLAVRVAQFDAETGRLDWERLESLVNDRTRVIALGASSNALGTINDVRRATRLARSIDAYSFIDAVHYAPHALIDVKDFDCDFLVCSAYKFYGPHTGVLYGKRDLLQSLDAPKLEPASNGAPERMETGTQSFESMCGTAAAIDFLASFGDGETRREKLQSSYARLHQRSEALFRQLWDGLIGNPLIEVYGPPPGADRAPTVSFVVRGFTARQISERLAERGVFVSHGNFYALTVAGRTKEGHPFAFRYTLPVDSAGQLPDGRPFADIHEFKRLLLGEEERVARNLVTQLVLYATGAPARFSDRAAVNRILVKAKARDYGLRSLIHGIVQSELFLNK